MLTLCEVIIKNDALRKLELVANGLDGLQMNKLAQALVYRRSVQCLNLTGNSTLGAKGLGCVASLLAQSIFLAYINLSDIPFTSKMAELLGAALPRSKLRTLIIHSAKLKSSSTLGPVARGAARCDSLSNVSLKSNAIAAAQAPCLLPLLSAQSMLACLDLRSNNLGDAGIAKLAPALSGNARLTHRTAVRGDCAGRCAARRTRHG